jgi:hypothetical protein
MSARCSTALSCSSTWGGDAIVDLHRQLAHTPVGLRRQIA